MLPHTFLSSHILMIEPAHFQFNEQTAESNSFQQGQGEQKASEIQALAKAEFQGFVKQLREKEVHVHVFADTPNPIKPDAVFPNNWVSFMPNGNAYLYPMCTPNRRLERRQDILQKLGETFDIKKTIDLSPAENKGQILEGTGSIIFDHAYKIAYACLSPRTDAALFKAHCEELGYEAISFTALDTGGKEIYHTNVMMCMGSTFSVICLESVANSLERQALIEKLLATKKEIIAISQAQMAQFAGNMLQVANAKGASFLVMSQTAYQSLTQAQIQQLAAHTQLLAVPIPTIERLGGGSARCMMAEIFCEVK